MGVLRRQQRRAKEREKQQTTVSSGFSLKEKIAKWVHTHIGRYCVYVYCLQIQSSDDEVEEHTCTVTFCFFHNTFHHFCCFNQTIKNQTQSWRKTIILIITLQNNYEY